MLVCVFFKDVGKKKEGEKTLGEFSFLWCGIYLCSQLAK